jgi:hypothetical protein
VNTRQTVEIAALISAYSPHVIERPVVLPKAALEQFWECSQKRLKLWLSAMAFYQRSASDASPQERLRLWQELEPTLVEIFVTEVLARVWGAILTSVDEEMGTHQYEPIARNVLIGHLDARKRALQLLAGDAGVTLEHLHRIDQVRRRVERWTDLLLGHLVERYQVEDFAFNAERSRDFGAQQLLQSTARPREQVWALVLVGLRMAFPTAANASPPNEYFQHQIIASILNCFPADSFQPEGPFRSILEGRVCRDGNRPEIHAAEDQFGASSPQLTLPTQSTISRIDFRKLRNRMPPPKG